MFLVDHLTVAVSVGRPSRTGDFCSHGHCAKRVVLRISRFVRVPLRRPQTAAARWSFGSYHCVDAAVLEAAVLRHTVQAVKARIVLKVG